MIKQTLLFGNRAYLSLKLNQLVIELPDIPEKPKQPITRPIEDIGILIIESHQVTLTSALLSSLLENNVAVITCDSRHMPNGLLLPLSGNTIQSERYLAQISCSLPLKNNCGNRLSCQRLPIKEKCLRSGIIKRANAWLYGAAT